MTRAPQHMREKLSLSFAFEFDQQRASGFGKWRASGPSENAFAFVDEGNCTNKGEKGRRFKSVEILSEWPTGSRKLLAWTDFPTWCRFSDTGESREYKLQP